MQQAVVDGIMRSIKYILRIAHATLKTEKVRRIDAFYQPCATEGATEEDVAQSKKAMSAIEVILEDQKRLERLAADIIAHYTQACDNGTDVAQKAMIVCSKRQIGYRPLQKFKPLRPDWFIERMSPDGKQLSPADPEQLSPMHTIAMVATSNQNDPPEMYRHPPGQQKARQAPRQGLLKPSKQFPHRYRRRYMGYRIRHTLSHIPLQR